jgi:hypothetical protein
MCRPPPPRPDGHAASAAMPTRPPRQAQQTALSTARCVASRGTGRSSPTLSPSGRRRATSRTRGRSRLPEAFLASPPHRLPLPRPRRLGTTRKSPVRRARFSTRPCSTHARSALHRSQSDRELVGRLSSTLRNQPWPRRASRRRPSIRSSGLAFAEAARRSFTRSSSEPSAPRPGMVVS